MCTAVVKPLISATPKTEVKPSETYTDAKRVFEIHQFEMVDTVDQLRFDAFI